jgi:hypothetical protein
LNNIFNIRLKASVITAGFFSCIVFGTSCKEKSFTNADVIPEIDNINTFEWVGENFGFTTQYDDSLLTNDVNYTLAALGNVNDPYFGNTRAGIYFQVAVPHLGFAFPDNMIVDSGVVSIPYFISNTGVVPFYGDTSSVVKWNVHRVTGDFEYASDKKYYASDSVAYDANALGSVTTKIGNLLDTFVLGNGDTVRNLLRIKLDKQFVQEVADIPEDNTGESFELQKILKGFYITPDHNFNTSNVLGMLILDKGSKASYELAQFTIYYHEQGTGTVRKIELPYKNIESLWFNRIRRSYTNAPANAFLNRTQADSAVIQSKPGIKTDLTIALDNTIGNVLVHKSDITLTVLKTGQDDIFRVPTQLIVKGINENNEEYDLLDFSSTSGYEYIQAQPVVETVDGVDLIRYHINIPRETQLLLAKGASQLKLRVYASNAHPGFYRAVFGGSKNAENYKPKMSIVYSKK